MAVAYIASHIVLQRCKLCNGTTETVPTAPLGYCPSKKNLPLIRLAVSTKSHPGLPIRIQYIRIRIQHFRLNNDLDPGEIWKKFAVEKKINFLGSKTTIFYIKDVQVKKEAFRSQKRTFCTPKHEIS
jgi:hypothetical protein